MTTPEFQQDFPKPWCIKVHGVSFSLCAANGNVVGYFMLQNRHSGVPQKEWNRHVAAALREYLTVEEAV